MPVFEFEPLKVETQKYFKWKIRLMLLAVIPFLYVGFVTGMNLLGERSYFILFLNEFYVLFAFILLIILLCAAWLHFYKRSTVKIRKTFQGEFHVVIDNGNGNEIQNTGKWTMNAQYVKLHYKMGTYQKQLYLTLYCNGKAFAVFFHHASTVYEVPDGFIEINQPALPDVPKFITPGVDRIFAFLKSA